jgi:hypothetical protein
MVLDPATGLSSLDPNMALCEDSGGAPVASSIFFVSFIWIASFIMLSLFVGSILISTMDSVMAIAGEIKAEQTAQRMRVKDKAIAQSHTLFERTRRQDVCRTLLDAWVQSPQAELAAFAKSQRKRLAQEHDRLKASGGLNAHGVAVVDPATDLARKEALKHGLAKAAYFCLSQLCQRCRDARLFTLLINVAILVACAMVGFQACEVGIPNGQLADLVLNAMFTVELLIKVVAEFDKPLRFFNSGWNRLDFVIVASAYTPQIGAAALLMRMVRLLRVLKVMRVVPDLRMLVMALVNSADSIGFVGLLLLLVFYVFSIFSMLFFRDNDMWHFRNLHTSIMTLFRVATSEDRVDVMYTAQFGCDKYPQIVPELCTKPEALGFQ